jgi:dihydrofolate reductase
VKLAIIAAVAENRVIGAKGGIPWHISDDLRRFKRLTLGHTVLMGRRTFESIGKPLPGRRNIVVTSSSFPGVECYPTIDSALAAAASDQFVFVIGGATLYTALIDRADLLYLTLVDQSPDGDTIFPQYDHLVGRLFRLIQREDHDGYHFVDYKRINEDQS